MTDPDVLATLAKLPPECFVRLPGSRGPRVVRIVRGVPGYTEMIGAVSADALNAALPNPPTPEQAEAMTVGSMFGWHVPAADPGFVRTNEFQT